MEPNVEWMTRAMQSVHEVDPDNNQHSPNENLRISNYFIGIRTISRPCLHLWSRCFCWISFGRQKKACLQVREVMVSVNH